MNIFLGEGHVYVDGHYIGRIVELSTEVDYDVYAISRTVSMTVQASLVGPDRPGWDPYFIGIARAVAARGDCRRRQVGAVLVDTEHRIVSTGYNGSPPGGPSCLAGECPRGRLSKEECPPGSDYSNCHALHAEVNAIVYAGRDKAKKATLYITEEPCDNCLKVIKAAGVKWVVTPQWRKKVKDL